MSPENCVENKLPKVLRGTPASRLNHLGPTDHSATHTDVAKSTNSPRGPRKYSLVPGGSDVGCRNEHARRRSAIGLIAGEFTEINASSVLASPSSSSSSVTPIAIIITRIARQVLSGLTSHPDEVRRVRIVNLDVETKHIRCDHIGAATIRRNRRRRSRRGRRSVGHRIIGETKLRSQESDHRESTVIHRCPGNRLSEAIVSVVAVVRSHLFLGS